MIERRLTVFVLLVFLTTLFILVLRAQGWASSGGVIFNSSPELRSCIADNGTGRESCGTTCLEQMEAAMRAMEEFTYGPYESTSVDAMYRSPQTILQMEIDSLNRREAARKQWNEVKARCWRKP